MVISHGKNLHRQFIKQKFKLVLLDQACVRKLYVLIRIIWLCHLISLWNKKLKIHKNGYFVLKKAMQTVY